MKNAILLSLFMLLQSMHAQRIERVEPEFWWAGFQRESLDILVYGEGIGDCEVRSQALPILGLTKTENPRYLFFHINTKDVSAGSYPIEFFKKGKRVAQFNYVFKPRKKDSALRQSFGTEDAIYLLMPDRFCNGNPNNDAKPELAELPNRSNPGGRHGGDLEGIIQRLDYLQDLGVTALWSTPLLEDNDSAYSYHGYAQSNSYRIDARYGGNEKYLELSQELHRRGMKLIMDFVTNHWGLPHHLVQDLPTYTWIHQFPGYGQTNYRTSTVLDPNASRRDRMYCSDGWFVKTMPDLNQTNPLVLNYLIQSALWWIEYADLDGFRVDTYSYGDPNSMATWTKAITDEFPNFNITGEIWMHDQAQIAYWQKDSKIGALKSYNSHLPAVMDFCFHDAVLQAFNENEGSWDKGLIRFYENLVNDFLYPNPANQLIFLENHDTQRFNEVYPDFKKYSMALSLLLTHRGIPQLYYGSEIGMQGKKEVGDGDVRRDFPGGWKGDPTQGFTPEGRTESMRAYFDFTKSLLNWRKNAPAVHHGTTIQFVPENNLYVYFRIHKDQRIMVLINNSNQKASIDWQRFKEGWNGFTKLKRVPGNQIQPMGEVTEVPAQTALIFELVNE